MTRRPVAAFAVAAALTVAPASAAPEPPPLPSCDLAQNCVCGVVTSVLHKATGRYWLYCV